MYIMSYISGNMNHLVVLHFETKPITPVTQVDFLFLPTANLFVAFVTYFLADQNAMRCFGVDLTFHLEHKNLTGLLTRYINLNGIINICTDF